MATLTILLFACAESPQEGNAPNPAAQAGMATPPATPVDDAPDERLARQVDALEKRYGAAQVAAMLESLRALAPYFEQEQIESGRAAAEHHWAQLDPRSRTAFADCLGWILERVEWIDAQAAVLPDGYHTAAYALPESKALYAAVVERYGLDPQTATSADVASSLSSYDDASLRFALAEQMCTMSEDERADYLARFAAAGSAALAKP
ncbi:MAG: hypothetical protein AAF184_18075 [Pseudomonadota bacterium]